MKVKSFFGKLFVSGLLLGGCLVFTSPHQEVQASFTHNINAQKAFKLSDKYVKNFDKKLSQGVYDRSDLRNVNLSKESTRKALRNQVLMLLAYDLNYGIDGYNTVGEVSNAITIHYDDTEYMDEFGVAGQDYKIVNGGENTLIANLVLNFVQGIGDKYLMHDLYQAYDGNIKQPKFTVENDVITLYVPFVYYDTPTRQYLAKQLSNKIKVLTGKTYKVKINTSKEENAIKYGGNVNSKTTLHFESIDDLSGRLMLFPRHEGFNIYSNKRNSFYNKKLPYYDGKTYYSCPQYYNMSDVKMADYLTERGIDLAEEYGADWGIGYAQRMALAEIVYYQFMSPTVYRVIFSDYTVTLRGGKTLDIEPSNGYIQAMNSGDLY